MSTNRRHAANFVFKGVCDEIVSLKARIHPPVGRRQLEQGWQCCVSIAEGMAYVTATHCLCEACRALRILCARLIPYLRRRSAAARCLLVFTLRRSLDITKRMLDELTSPLCIWLRVGLFIAASGTPCVRFAESAE